MLTNSKGPRLDKDEGLYHMATILQGFKRTFKNESLPIYPIHKCPFINKHLKKYNYRHFDS